MIFLPRRNIDYFTVHYGLMIFSICSLALQKLQFLAAHFWYKIFGAILFAHCARAILRESNVECGTACTVQETANDTCICYC
jgi:hypothetical protein